MKNNLNELLWQLVNIRSDVSSTSNEQKLASWIASQLKAANWQVKKLPVNKNRYNLLVSRSNNPQIVLLGHMDTVPLGSCWRPQKTKQKIKGRGSVDMKAGLALMLNFALNTEQKDVALLLTVDEEYDFLGMKEVIKAIKSKNISWDPELVINLEPTDLKLGLACRGLLEVKATLKGKSVHAADAEQGVNAISKAVEFTNRLQEDLSQLGQGELVSSVNLGYLRGGIKDENQQWLVRPNVVPDVAQAVWDVRLGNIKKTEKEWKTYWQELATQVGLKCEQVDINLLYNSMQTTLGEVVDWLQVYKSKLGEPEIVNPNRTGYYEAQMLEEIWECAVVVFGPGPADTAHTTKEYVDLGQLNQASKVLNTFLSRRKKG